MSCNCKNLRPMKLNPSIRIKAGVVLFGVKDNLFEVANKVADVFNEHGYYCMITSGREGLHSSPNSRHYKGEALDFRTRHIKWSSKVKKIAEEVREILGDGYRVIVEKTHIHIQTA